MSASAGSAEGIPLSLIPISIHKTRATCQTCGRRTTIGSKTGQRLHRMCVKGNQGDSLSRALSASSGGRRIVFVLVILRGVYQSAREVRTSQSIGKSANRTVDASRIIPTSAAHGNCTARHRRRVVWRWMRLLFTSMSGRSRWKA